MPEKYDLDGYECEVPPEFSHIKNPILLRFAMEILEYGFGGERFDEAIGSAISRMLEIKFQELYPEKSLETLDNLCEFYEFQDRFLETVEIVDKKFWPELSLLIIKPYQEAYENLFGDLP